MLIHIYMYVTHCHCYVVSTLASYSRGPDLKLSPETGCYKGKAVPQHTYGGARGERSCSSYSFITSALDGGEWSVSCPGRALPPGKGPPVPIGQEADWAPELVWSQRLGEKSFAFSGDQNWITQSSSL
jgi:hypothetical protein